MADITRELQLVISAKDEATKTVKSFGASFSDLSRDVQIGAAIIVGSLGLIAKGMIDTAANMEQTRISFETFLGSGEKAGKLLKDLSDFAAKTPFDLPQVLDGSKRLLAYGVDAESIIPTFKMLGDIAAGVGTDKLPQLILAFGQVSAATKLTGMELRQFSEAGVPLLGALVDKANETGGVITKIGGISKEQAKSMGSLTSAIADQEFRMKLLTDAGKNHGVSWDMLTHKYDQNKAKLSEYGSIGEAVYKKVKVSAEDMIERISDSKVKFGEVQEALSGMTSEGGRFYNLMEKQSQTFSGVISNTRDEFVRFSLSVMGFTQEGEIRNGSIFFYLKDAAEKFLEVLKIVRPEAEKFFDLILKNPEQLIVVFAALSGLLIPLSAGFIALVAPAILLSGLFALGATAALQFYNQLKELEKAWPGIVEGVELGKVKFFEFVEFVKTIPGLLIQWEIDAKAQVYKFFIEDIPYAVGYAAGWLSVEIPKLVNRIIDDLSKIPGPSTLIFESMRKGIETKITEAQNFLITTLTEWPAKIMKMIQAIPGIVDTIFNDSKESVNTRMKETFDAVTGWWNQIKGVLEGIRKAAEDAWNAVQKGFQAGSSGMDSKQHGGFVPGGYGDAVPTVLHGGERVIPRNGTDVNPGSGGGGGAVTINITGTWNLDSEDRVSEMANQIISILGRQNELASKGVGF